MVSLHAKGIFCCPKMTWLARIILFWPYLSNFKFTLLIQSTQLVTVGFNEDMYDFAAQ